MDVGSERRTTHAHVVESLGRMVMTWPEGGAPLPVEAELCETLGVGRSALREAIKALVGKGLIEVRPRIGTRVRSRHLWNKLDPDVLRWSVESDRERTLVELNELRDAIEPVAAGLAAQYADADQVSELWGSYMRMEDAVSAGDLDAFISADAAFHSTLLSAGGNELFRSLGHTLGAVLQDSFRAGAGDIDEVSQSVELHRAVVAAVASRLPGAAVESMREVVHFTVGRIGKDRHTPVDVVHA